MRKSHWLVILFSFCVTACSPPSFQSFQTKACQPNSKIPVIDNATLIKFDKMSMTLIPQGNALTVVLGTDDFYRLNSPSLLQSKDKDLAQLAKLLAAYGPVNIKVAGYTDNVASPAYNLKVSEQQARSMTTFLWTHGIQAQQLYAVGYGEREPIADNATVGGSHDNRRIEISLKASCLM